MSYKYSKGAQVIGDLKAADDTQRDTLIDFGEDYIGFETSGSARMVVSGSNIGIGTTTPGTLLHISGSSPAITLQRDNNSNDSSMINFEGQAGSIACQIGQVAGVDNELAFSTHDGSLRERMRIDVDGNVGIGTAAPDYELDVAGDIGVDQYIRHNDNGNTHINFTVDKINLKAGNKSMVTMEEKGTSPHEVTINDGGNNIDFVVKGNGSNEGNPLLMCDASNNRVGINGVGSPAYELDVDGDIGLSEYIYHKGDDDTFIRFEDDEMSFNAGGRTFINLQEGASDLLVINNGGLDIDLKVSGENQANLIRTDAANDRVGINTSSPTATLAISGTLDVSGSLTIGSGVNKYTLPTVDGSAYQVLKTNGSGAVSWQPEAGGGSPTEVLKITLAENTNFQWNGSSHDYHQVPFARTLVDTYSSNPYNTGTNYFTAPSNGIYEFHVRLTLNNIQSGATQYQAWLMTTSGSGVFSNDGYHASAVTQFDPPTSQSIIKLDMYTVVEMSANHSASVFIRQLGGNQNNCHLMHQPMQTSLIIKKL